MRAVQKDGFVSRHKAGCSSQGTTIDRQGFSRRNRLLSAADFSRVFRNPERSGDKFFTILAKPNQQDYPRLGLAIAKRSVKKAVDRNRIKRLARESFRTHQHILSGLDIVVLAKFGANIASNAQLFASLEAHWQHLRRK